VAHADPQKTRFAREIGEKYPPDPQRVRGAWHVLRTGEPELYPDISDDMLARLAENEAHLAVLRSAGMRSVIMVPIRIRDRVSGTLTLVSAHVHRRYDEEDVQLVQELGRRAGTAIENAKLFAAEKLAREQLALLARAGEAFSSAVSYEDTLHSVVDTALPALADFAFFDVVEGDRVRRLSAAHEDPETDELLQHTQWVRSERKDKNLCALSSGTVGFHPHIDDAFMEDIASGPEHLALLKKLKLTSMVTVPLRAQGDLLGSLTVCYGKSGRHHTEDDMWLAEELARRAAIALVQVRLYARAQESAAAAADAARRAEEASRVKDEFLATVSHELRTPLNAIMGWSSLLLGRNPPPGMLKGIDVIHRNARTQAKIIEDILDVSRIITGKLRLEPKPTDMVAIVRDALEVIRPSALAKDLTIEFAPPAEVCLLVADPERLQQVVWNLLSNAVKFTDTGGSIVTTLAHEGERVSLTVSDTGRGIASEFLPFVFDRFKQADSSTTRRVGGLGLGLAIVRHIVELHGGQVRAESEGLGHGARFTLTLPVRAVAPVLEEADASWPGDEPQTETSEGSLKGLKVLVVDDEADARELVQTVLTEAGAEVEIADAAESGLELILRFRPHVLVSDIGMPGVDGYAFIQRVKTLPAELGGGIPSVALTAYTRTSDKSKALAMGFTTHIGKPVNPADLIAAVLNLAAFVHRPET
jgi:signal transduction histidine kinase/ActR/RegA family two-component response regulator